MTNDVTYVITIKPDMVEKHMIHKDIYWISWMGKLLICPTANSDSEILICCRRPECVLSFVRWDRPHRKVTTADLPLVQSIMLMRGKTIKLPVQSSTYRYAQCTK